ncbi:MAG: hypothetical protein H6832_04425 [Planctomycetes bacterium]|nr:hypothetical protein [Planctomycetota bacterium]MCB9890385.1 hypothetical protein [Planctomycetota bacterium]MCB9917627.1 hypothetical protein [Planctomycetota bacterium]
MLSIAGLQDQSRIACRDRDAAETGAPGCYLVASYDMLIGASATTSYGTAAIPIQVPSDASLVGNAFHNQWFVLDAGANKLGLTFSNGGTAIVGR